MLKPKKLRITSGMLADGYEGFFRIGTHGVEEIASGDQE
jgi:hypothetical protein